MDTIFSPAVPGFQTNHNQVKNLWVFPAKVAETSQIILGNAYFCFNLHGYGTRPQDKIDLNTT